VIVTRRRRKQFPWKRIAVPVIALAIVVGAFTWPPSQHWIATGPLAPAWRAAAPVGAPLHFAAQNQTITDQNRQIIALQKQLAVEKTQTADRDKRISSLQTQLNQAQTRAAQAQAPAPRESQANNVQSAGASIAQPAAQTEDLAQSGTPDMRRTAQEWGSMDAEAAAKVVQKLPLAYVARIFALMSPDAAGAILENVPPAYAAALTQEHPELRR
jgi:flagellar motility protein MotE (MotC chaperone)